MHGLSLFFTVSPSIEITNDFINTYHVSFKFFIAFVVTVVVVGSCCCRSIISWHSVLSSSVEIPTHIRIFSSMPKTWVTRTPLHRHQIQRRKVCVYISVNERQLQLTCNSLENHIFSAYFRLQKDCRQRVRIRARTYLYELRCIYLFILLSDQKMIHWHSFIIFNKRSPFQHHSVDWFSTTSSSTQRNTTKHIVW